MPRNNSEQETELMVKEKEVSEAINSVMNGKIEFYRVFSNQECSRTITKSMNSIMEEHPEYGQTVVILMLYPALKWMLTNKDIDVLIARCENMDVESVEQNGIGHLRQIQEWLKGYVDEHTIHFQKRSSYFGLCEDIVKLVQKFKSEMPFEDGFRNEIADAFSILIGETHSVPKHPRRMKEYAGFCVSAMYRLYGNKISELYNEIMADNECMDAEAAFLYHNVPILIKEYARILWNAETSSDPAMRILASATKEELDNTKISDQKTNEAYVLIQYACLINGAIKSLQKFPGLFDYYELIETILDGIHINAYDSELARNLSLSASSFSKKKACAYGILGCALWGCDAKFLLEYLTSDTV